ncbi:unnamed protein product [Phaedon cochleariae]|uniref:Carboxylesterase type B domain-containing protein n=1 Tax=Phaedon cochleariae TaxID=80249 RepID=A0A9P0DSK2_PHACE|nr:unnamed protein product [Phaedon cochleariae]
MDVIAHIHGGGFMIGGTNDFVNPKYVMDIDAIFVTFTYRLGILGFLSTEDGVVPGNNGLKDQTLALRWIQSNIASFGGNPQSVTLTGFDAGASCTHFHYFSPMSEGLFRRGLSLSATALNFFAIQRNPRSRAETVAAVVGCPTTDTKTMVECLKTKPAPLLIDSMKHLQPLDQTPFALFAPVVEVNNPANPFLTEHPYEMLKKGKVLDVPWMSSVTENDGLIYLPLHENNLDQINSQWEKVANLIVDYDGMIPESHYLDAARRIRDFYFPNGVSMSKENHQNLEKMFTDWIFLLPAEQAVIMQSRITNSSIYFFRMSYSGQNSLKYSHLGSPQFVDIEGTWHGDDVVYFFGGLITKDLSENEKQMKNSCLNMLYSYAKYGHPVFHNTELNSMNDENEFFFYNISGPQDIQKQISTQDAAISLWTDIMGYSNAYNIKYGL